ncbi:hypothetical protein [Haloparvum sedimenti]|uniref:hypothetical protein n=1 Tax=Haloparvum sedimenti TaxID=1678448 RepID=UPI00071E8074|nr:hypothetical protein [Haloparvum sedimenti]
MANGADCPVEECGFSDVPSLVAAHVNGTDDDAHDWDRLPYAGPGAFLSAVRSGETEARSGPSGVVDAPDGVEHDADEGEDDADEDEADGSASGSTPDRVRCPVEGCSYAGPPKSVAAHVSGKRDDDHDMRRLEYPNAAAFPPAPGAEDGTDAVGGGEPDHPFDPEPAFRAAAVAEGRAEGVESLDGLGTEDLVDLFVAFSVLSSRASSVRSDVRAAIIDRVEEEAELEGDLGSVDRSTGTRRSLRDDGTVRRALARAGVDPHEAEAFDPDRVADLAEAADLEPEAVFDLTDSDHVRRASVDEAAFDALLGEE